MTETYATVLDLRLYAPEQRLPLVELTLEHLRDGESAQIITRAEPTLLRRHVAICYGEQFRWRTDERGPEIWTAVVARTQTPA